jgi:hypothetical protein
MKQISYYKLAFFLTQCITIGMMFYGIWLQHFFLKSYEDHVKFIHNFRVAAAEKLIEAQKAQNSELQTALVSGSIKIQEDSEGHFLEGTEHLQYAFRKLLVGAILVNLVGIVILWYGVKKLVSSRVIVDRD